MPGVCPACGRDLKLEAIVASLPRPENAVKRKKRPLDWSECAWAAIAFCLLLCGIAGFVWKDMRVEMDVYMFILGAPNFFLGFFTAGFFSRTVMAQLLWGILLSVVFAVLGIGLLYAGCGKLGL